MCSPISQLLLERRSVYFECGKVRHRYYSRGTGWDAAHVSAYKAVLCVQAIRVVHALFVGLQQGK